MGYFLFDADRLDSGTRRTATHRRFDAVHRLTFAFEVDLDATVCQVPDPPMHAFDHGALLREEPKTDALDAAADEQSSGDLHEATDY